MLRLERRKNSIEHHSHSGPPPEGSSGTQVGALGQRGGSQPSDPEAFARVRACSEGPRGQGAKES